IQPVTVDEFRIAVAETYDVIVEPEADRAYTLFAQTNDRTGFARGTLTTNPELHAEVPEMDPAPVLGHRDMGMDMSGSDHSNHGGHGGHDSHNNHDMSHMNSMDHSGHDMGEMDHGDHGQHSTHNQHTHDPHSR